MAGAIALGAEVTRGADQALTEVVLPDAIDENAGGERIRGIGNGVGEFEASGALTEAFRIAGGEHGNEVGRGRRARIIPVPAQPDLLHVQLLLIFDDLQIRVFRRHRFLQRREFFVQLQLVFFPRSREEAIDLAIAEMQQAAVTEDVVPKEEAVAIHGDQVGLAQIVAVRIQAERDVVLVVDQFLLSADFDQQGLKFRRGGPASFRSLSREPRFEKGMVFIGRRQVLLPLAAHFVVERFVRSVSRHIEHVSAGAGGEDFGQTVRLRLDESVEIFLFIVRFLLRRLIVVHLLFGRERRLAQICIREDAEQRVIIGLRNGIELMVVALRAGDGEAEEAAGGGVHAIILHFRTQGVKAQAGDVLVFIGKLIARDLCPDESVVGHVGIEGVDDPVAVAERVGVRLILGGVQLIVRITRDIEPVTAPALPVTRGCEQRINHFREGIGRFVASKRFHLFGGRRQAGQIQISPADESPAIRGSYRSQVLFFEFREDKAVQIIVRPLCVFDFGRRDLRDRFKRPERTLLLTDHVFGRRRCGARGPDSARLNPRGHRVDLFVFELAAGRHFEPRMRLAQGLDEEASVGISGHDSRTRFSAGHQVFARVELQTAGLRIRMARIALRRQQRSNVEFEILRRVTLFGGAG